MSDVDELLRSDAERWRAAQPVFDLDAKVAALSRRPPRRYLLPVLAAALVVAVAVGIVALASRPRTVAPADNGLSKVTGVTWRDPDSTGTVVYTATTMRLFDGCSDELAQLRVTNGTLAKGPAVDGVSTCTGSPSVPGPAGAAQRAAQRRLDHFHAVIAGPAMWSRVGNVLALSTPGKGILRLTTDDAPAPELVGTTWHLSNYAGADDNERPSARALALRVDADGSFEADLSCGRLTGTAEVGAATVDFALAHDGGCASSADPADAVIRAIISGHATYAVRGQQLILYDSRGWMLVYDASGS